LSPTDPNLYRKEALDHAWNWFSLHASQRMQSFNFFLVAVAFLVAGYGTVVDKHPAIAVGIGGLGAWLSFWFNRLERRSKQLVKAGEVALGYSQARLAELEANPAMRILDVVEKKAPGSSSYGVVINVVQWSIISGFALSAVYAGWVLCKESTGVHV